MSWTVRRLRKARLQTLLFAFLAVFGILPVVITVLISVGRNRELLEQSEKLGLSREAEALSQTVGQQLTSVERQLSQLGAGLLQAPPSAGQRWLGEYLTSFVSRGQPDFITLVQDMSRPGSMFRPPQLPAPIEDRVLRVVELASSGEVPRHLFVGDAGGTEPWILVTHLAREPDAAEDSAPDFVLIAAMPLPLAVDRDQELFLLDIEDGGRVLWSPITSQIVKNAVERSAVVQDSLQFAGGTYPVLEYPVRTGAATRSMIGQISKLGDTGWAVLVQKRKSAALAVARGLVRSAFLSAAITVGLALLAGAIATRVLSSPIQTFAETSREIASGKFGQRVGVPAMGIELGDLADSFNQMSAHVEDHVERLQKAARENRELFLGSVRSLLRAVEAKEPYTRGHSERVASYSQAICRHLSESRDFQEQLWLAGLLHDVGKIGIEDRVLNKGDVLTDEEFEEMKKHPVIGAEIMSSIESLHPLLPAIRWHHESWAGGGYPDGLVGEEIPMMARIVAVADTFDAVTTQRVYQDPYTTDQAIEIIKRLEGKKFDPRIVGAFIRAWQAGDLVLLPMSANQVAAAPTEQTQTIDERAAVHT